MGEDAEYRIEHDTMGEVRVPVKALWRAQTQRAVENFPISGRGLERTQIRALGLLKGACAQVNKDLGLLAPEKAEAMVAEFGPAARMLGATLRNVSNPTMLDAGYKVNVIPTEATARVDGRFLPGHEDEFHATLAALAGDDVEITRETNMRGLETSYDGDVADAITASIVAEDPDALVAPYLMSGGTDAKWFAELGIRGFGFTPLRLPEELDFTALFHGVDERVPVDSLTFGARVFDGFLDRVSGR